MRPEGVQIVKKNGLTFEPELRHDGVDADGMDQWTAVFEGQFVINEDQLKVKRLPPRTSIGVAVRTPKDWGGDLHVKYGVKHDEGCSNLNTSTHNEVSTEGEAP